MVSEMPEAETQTLEAEAEVSAHSDEASKPKDTPVSYTHLTLPTICSV